MWVPVNEKNCEIQCENVSLNVSLSLYLPKNVLPHNPRSAQGRKDSIILSEKGRFEFFVGGKYKESINSILCRQTLGMDDEVL